MRTVEREPSSVELRHARAALELRLAELAGGLDESARPEQQHETVGLLAQIAELDDAIEERERLETTPA